MRDLIRDLIPHAPEMGLYVAPDIPEGRLRNAIRDYAPGVADSDVMALYDATLLKSARDGAVFTDACLVFQNSNLQTPQTVWYRDIVQVASVKKLLGGRQVKLKVNRGRATVELIIDFSGKPDAAEHVTRFLSEAVLVAAEDETPLGTRRRTGDRRDTSPGEEEAETDRHAVRSALERLRAERKLSAADFDRLMDLLG